MNKVLIGWGIDPKFADMFDETIIALLMVGLSIGLDYLCQAIFVGGMKHYARRSPHQWNTLLMKRRVIHHLIHILPGILIYYLLPMAFVRGKEMLEFSQKVCAVYIIVAVLLTINGLLLVMLDVYNMKDKQKNRPLKGFVQVLQVLLFFIGGIIVVSVLIGKSPMTLFAGLGASAAVCRGGVPPAAASFQPRGAPCTFAAARQGVCAAAARQRYGMQYTGRPRPAGFPSASGRRGGGVCLSLRSSLQGPAKSL